MGRTAARREKQTVEKSVIDMKKIAFIALCICLCVSLLAGCAAPAGGCGHFGAGNFRAGLFSGGYFYARCGGAGYTPT